MICTLTIGGFTLDLAGGQGFPSETSGLTIDNQPVFQQTAYIGEIEGRQFARPGAMTSVSFQSNLTFPSKEEADFYLLTLPGDLKDQRGATAKLGVETAAGTKQVETLTVTGSPSASGNITVTLTAANVTGSPISFSFAVTNGEDPTDWGLRLTQRIRQETEFMKRFSIGGLFALSGGGTITATARQELANDSTLAIAFTNGSPSPGLTPATSANTTAGVAPTLSYLLNLYDVSARVTTLYMGATVRLSVNLTGRITAP